MPHVVLHEFMAVHRDDIVRRCRAQAPPESIPAPTDAEINQDVPLFVDQLVDTLRFGRSTGAIGTSAGQHGQARRLQGFAIAEVVHDYGAVCQAVTGLAVELDAPISTEDFRRLNRCLDDAIAAAVSEYAIGQNQTLLYEASARSTHRLARLTHALRNRTGAAILAFQALKTGNVSIDGPTGALLERSLRGIRALIKES